MTQLKFIKLGKTYTKQTAAESAEIRGYSRYTIRKDGERTYIKQTVLSAVVDEWREVKENGYVIDRVPSAWRWELATGFEGYTVKGGGLWDIDGCQVRGFSQFELPESTSSRSRYLHKELDHEYCNALNANGLRFWW